jgi:hypothetical protein
MGEILTNSFSFKTSLNGVFIVVAPELNSNSVNIFSDNFWQLIHDSLGTKQVCAKVLFLHSKNKGTWKLKL